MKKLIFLLIAVIALSNCSAQTTNNKLNIKKREKITNNRKFDIEEYRKVIKKNPFADRMLRTDKNGMVIEMNTKYDKSEIIGYREDCSYPHSPYTYSYEYNTEGYLIKSWATFYGNMRVGKMIEYDANGFKIKETDFDAPYKFSVTDLVNKMQKDYHIDLMDKQNVFSINRFDHKDLRTAYYEVIVYGNSCAQKLFYYLDGTTGDLLFKTSRIFGDEGMKGQELPFDEYLRKKERK